MVLLYRTAAEANREMSQEIGEILTTRPAARLGRHPFLAWFRLPGRFVRRTGSRRQHLGPV